MTLAMMLAFCIARFRPQTTPNPQPSPPVFSSNGDAWEALKARARSGVPGCREAARKVYAGTHEGLRRAVGR